MDVYTKLAELQAKIANGSADPNMIRDFLGTYGAKLEALGLGEVVAKLGAEYDFLAGRGDGQQAPQSGTTAAATGFATGFGEGLKKVGTTFAAMFGWAPDGTAPPTPPIIKWGLAGLVIIAGIIYIKK